MLKTLEFYLPSKLFLVKNFRIYSSAVAKKIYASLL